MEKLSYFRCGSALSGITVRCSALLGVLFARNLVHRLNTARIEVPHGKWTEFTIDASIEKTFTRSLFIGCAGIW